MKNQECAITKQSKKTAEKGEVVLNTISNVQYFAHEKDKWYNVYYNHNVKLVHAAC